MKRIYVASPYAGDIEKNTEFAKDACRHVMSERHAFLLYRKLRKSTKMVYNELEIKNYITKERM